MKIVEENEDYIVIEVSGSGEKTYRVGYPKASGYRADDLIQGLSKAAEQIDSDISEESWRSVNWAPNGKSETSRKAITRGLIGGFVDKASSYLIYEYRINFANFDRQSFRFKDETDDTYVCITLRAGNHYIDYNSDKPTIVGVS